METLNIVSELSTVDAKIDSGAQLLGLESRYKIIRLLAKGGMAYVFLAKDLKCQRYVALKMMHPKKGIAELDKQRFIEEVQITSQLDHPSIISIYDLCQGKNGEPFYAMKLVRGETLEEILKQVAANNEKYISQYPLRVLLQIFIKICDAITYAASKYIVHRDLKPDNIMIGQYGEVYVMDWGIAKVCTPWETKQLLRKQSIYDFEDSFVRTLREMSDTQSEATAYGQFLGTPMYMAPEQICADFEIDTRADIYALGVILYRIVYLSNPFSQSAIKNIFKEKLKGDLDFSKKTIFNSGCKRSSEILNSVIRKAMAVNLSERYQKTSDLKVDVDSWLHGYATVAEDASQIRLIKLLLSRHKNISLVLSLFFISLGSFCYQGYLNVNDIVIDKDFLELELNHKSMESKKRLIAKLKLEQELNEYRRHISGIKEQLATYNIDEANIKKVIELSEQLVILDPSSKNYQNLISLYITNKNYEKANDSLVYALASYPQDSELANLINNIK
ncbi:serine/threonine-protein kinase [Lentisphaera profundi]|uniref:Serine/threonine-protein kinase n=1 Tax=Lentisphaera profundi TaxID=1658616 RepID=A0ABY7VTS7_9BACT|nr:serine/threonine-protein kinase [Lentisphaera profundi]WDE96625.1 serine/threonine-protein kinase [Lentisphaera profundi]